MHRDGDRLVELLSRHLAQADQRTTLVLPDRIDALAVQVARDLELQREQAPCIRRRRFDRLRGGEGGLVVGVL